MPQGRKQPLIEYSGSLPLRFDPPASCRYDRPHRLDQSEGPSALQKAVDRTQPTRKGKGQDEPRTALLAGVTDQHRRYRKETKCCERPYHSKRSEKGSIFRNPRNTLPLDKHTTKPSVLCCD